MTNPKVWSNSNSKKLSFFNEVTECHLFVITIIVIKITDSHFSCKCHSSTSTQAIENLIKTISSKVYYLSFKKKPDPC